MIRCRRCREVQGSSTVALAEREPATQVGAATPTCPTRTPTARLVSGREDQPEARGDPAGCVEVTAETTLTTEPGELRTPGTDGHVRLARSVPGIGRRQALQQRAGQQVKQEKPGTDRGGPAAPARDELDNDGRCGPVADA